MTRTVPLFEPAQCVRAALRAASCAECALACPAGAITPEAGTVQVDADLCSGCGQCQGGCPTHALGDPHVPPADGALMVLACSKTAGAATIGCAHAPGLETLAQWWLAGIRVVAVATDECASCPDAPRVLLSDRVERLNALLEPRGLDVMRLRRAQSDERSYAAAPADLARRNILTRGKAPKKGALVAIARLAPGPLVHAPRINPERCSGCNACIRICPEGVLSLIKDADGSLFYTCDAEPCTGCALCEDICDDNALSLHENAVAPPPVALRAFTCAMCGVDCVEPEGRHGDHCRICRARPHASRLYQILD